MCESHKKCSNITVVQGMYSHLTKSLKSLFATFLKCSEIFITVKQHS